MVVSIDGANARGGFLWMTDAASTAALRRLSGISAASRQIVWRCRAGLLQRYYLREGCTVLLDPLDVLARS